MVEPEAGGGAAEEEVVGGEEAPGCAGIDVAGAAAGVGDAEGIERDALRVEHAEDVVVGGEEESGGVGEGVVRGEPGGVGVAVLGEDGEVADGGVELGGEGALGGVGGEEAVGIEHGRVFAALRMTVTRGDGKGEQER